MDWLATVSVLFSVFFAVMAVERMRRALPAGELESWRDRPPLFFRLLAPLIGGLAPLVGARMDPRQRDALLQRLESAGMAYALKPEEMIVARRLGLAIALLLVVYLYWMLDLRTALSFSLVAVLLPLGYYYPDLWLRDAVKRRQAHIEKQFPFFLELLVLAMRAGLNFSSAVSHSTERIPEGPVRDEFKRMLREVRTGMSRRLALNHLARRIDLPAVTNFVASINQAEETGGEIGNVLMQQARQRRTERFLKAEKLANQAPVKMLGPLVGLLFPITFIIIVFPIFIKARDSGTLGFFN
ncbi:MAG TPA: type II secretion system F family protein [Thiotrichales bacterium]|nr:type II secretion system F family protein [Thiotrichales bacterium]